MPGITAPEHDTKRRHVWNKGNKSSRQRKRVREILRKIPSRTTELSQRARRKKETKDSSRMLATVEQDIASCPCTFLAAGSHLTPLHSPFTLPCAQPLVAAEFVAPLAKCKPVFDEEDAEFAAWYSKTPLGKKRGKVLRGEEDDAEGGDAKSKPKKGGKKKKK